MKKAGLSVTLFVFAFIASYLFCCYLIPGWRIKLYADPLTYFFASVKHMVFLKSLVSLVAGPVTGALPIVICKLAVQENR